MSELVPSGRSVRHAQVGSFKIHILFKWKRKKKSLEGGIGARFFLYGTEKRAFFHLFTVGFLILGR